MKLIIDIPKDVYEETLRTEAWNECEQRAIRFAIRNCTRLPKRHGRLIDADKTIQQFLMYYNRAVDNKVIFKPVAWALYQTWKWADEREKPRAEGSKE